MMKFFHYAKDGGPDSTVWGYWLLEWKKVCSIALLCFEDGSREEHHSHAFNSISWVLTGRLLEHYLNGPLVEHRPGLAPIITTRDTFHRVASVGRTWTLTFRGPWADKWHEFHPAKGVYTLTHGRKVI
jgi:quercetin dioxygenase-like cupin family protein